MMSIANRINTRDRVNLRKIPYLTEKIGFLSFTLYVKFIFFCTKSHYVTLTYDFVSQEEQPSEPFPVGASAFSESAIEIDLRSLKYPSVRFNQGNA